MESGSLGDGQPSDGSESLAVAPNLVFGIFQSAVDLGRGRLFGGVYVLPLGFLNRLHGALARAVGRASGRYGLSTARVHTGLSVTLGPLWLLRTVANGAFSSGAPASLPGWSSAIFCRHLTRSRGCGSPKCAKGSRREHPGCFKCYGTSCVSGGWLRFVVFPGTRPD